MAERFYKRGAEKLPSVTTICGQLDKSGPLTYWAASCAADYILKGLEGSVVMPMDDLRDIIERSRKEFRSVSAKALDTGSAVHEAVERYLKTGQEPQAPSDQVLSAFLAFLEWKDQHHLEVIQTEHTVYGSNFAGTTDLVCYLDAQKAIVDFKTSKQPKGNKPYEEWGIQTAAYRSCVQDVTKNGILRLDKETGIPDWYDLSDNYSQDLKTFRILTDLWYARHPNHK